jgi:hypothetical protein
MKSQRHREIQTRIAATVLLVLLVASGNLAVTSKVTRQATSKDLLEGEAEGVVISSRGTIELGRASTVLQEEFEDVWSVSSIVVSGGAIFIGTSPNGCVYRHSLGKLTKIYPVDDEADSSQSDPPQAPRSPAVSEDDEADQADEPADEEEDAAETVEDDEPFGNEHIFAMGMDVAGRLLAGISGEQCKLCRYEGGRMETIFEPNDAKYILALETDNVGNIYLGTGPEGKVYVLDPSGKVAQLVYDSPDKNILSLAAGKDGFVYAGSDTRGLIYKLNPRNKTATVLYDSEEPEISALLFSGGTPTETGDLYAAATSAKVVQTETEFASQQVASGRPEPSEERNGGSATSDGGTRLQIANTSNETAKPPEQRPQPVARGQRPGTTSHLYRITRQGYVTDVFTESAVLLCMAPEKGKLLVGTGNDGRLFSVDPAAEQQSVVYEDEQAAQITTVTTSGDDVYIGTANPAKLIMLSPDYATKGTYISGLIDAEQPAKWGKLQIDADIPSGCRVLVASRSGNVNDVNDPTFSDWTELVEVTEPIQLRCPVGRFCQYKLVLETDDGLKSPVIREVAVASTVPNLAPQVESVDITAVQGAGKEGTFKIAYKATDRNEDTLIYTIYFRRIGRTSWIEMEDEIEAATFDWDGKTVEDGRYELRVVASDERGNSPSTKLTGARISDPVVVDNTGPVIRKYSVERSGPVVTLKLQVTDDLSALGSLAYTIDSNAEWKGALPDDLVFDTTDESFTVITEALEPGEHVIALKIADAVGNTTFKTFEVSVLDQ